MVRRKQKVLMILLAVAVVTLLFTTIVAANPTSIKVERWVIAAGGVRVTPQGHEIEVTIGQYAVGEAGSKSSGRCAGYWCDGEYNVYLPVNVR